MSLVVAQTMVLLAFVSCCGASSRLVNFLTIKVFKFYFMFDLNFYFVYFFLFGLILGRGGGTLVIFGWVCAARDLKLAPRSRVQQEYNSLLVNSLNRIFKSNLSLNTFKWLLTKVELSCVRNIIPHSRKGLRNGYPVLNQELQNHDPFGRHIPV